MLKKNITLKGRHVEYCLTRRPRMKHLKVRVRPDGTVNVSAPPQVTLKRIEEFLVSHSDFVIETLDKSAKQAEAAGNFGDGCVLVSLGEPFTVSLRLGVGAKPKASADGSTLNITAPDTDKAAQLAVKWLNDRLRDYLSDALDRYYPAVAGLGVDKPRFSLKNMTSRWGSCSSYTHRLAFSTMLREYPREAVDYIVMHELAHFIHPNHSKDFHAFVARFMPDWKECDKLLKTPRKNCV